MIDQTVADPPAETAWGTYRKIQRLPLVREMLETITCMVLVLREDHRIVHANPAFQKFVGLGGVKPILGRHVGEALQCLHAVTSEKGCGTTVFCRYCGVTRAGKAAHEYGEATRELRMLREGEGRLEAADLRVTARRLLLDGDIYTILALADVSDEKRREQLERAFLHDLLNSASVLKGLSWAVRHGEVTEEVAALLEGSVGQLVEEIRVQRMFARAETGELEPELRTVDIGSLIEDVARQYRTHLVAKERRLEADSGGSPVVALTDAVLLRRVIGNLVKNALEATEPEGTVTISCRGSGERTRIEVHNPSSIPDEVRFQIFNRSFSTKGAGRGFGTYSVKLLTERYLEGQVDFTSTAEDGTTFRVSLPGAPG